MLDFKSFDTATCMLAGVKTMNMIKKEQVDLQNRSVRNQKIHSSMISINSIKNDSARDPHCSL